jgi:hypothetical protein
MKFKTNSMPIEELAMLLNTLHANDKSYVYSSRDKTLVTITPEDSELIADLIEANAITMSVGY